MTDEALNQDGGILTEAEAPTDAAPIEEVAEAPAATTSARLVLKRGGVETDIEFPIGAKALIGRFDASVGPIDVDLGSLQPEGGYVSRKHARITLEDGTWFIEDLGSSNGTFLLRDDFERVEKAELLSGVEIALGNARFVFHTP